MQRSQHICNLGIFGDEFCDKKNKFFEHKTNHVSLYSNTYVIHLYFFTKKEKREKGKQKKNNTHSILSYIIAQTEYHLRSESV